MASEREPYPSEKQERFIVRLPDGMRDRIKAAADQNFRSMNAEIVATLEHHYPPPHDRNVAIADYIKELAIVQESLSKCLDQMTPHASHEEMSELGTRYNGLVSHQKEMLAHLKMLLNQPE